jgi:hypothetical protein
MLSTASCLDPFTLSGGASFLFTYAVTDLLQVWEGRYWKKTTLRALGFVYQLGHGGFPCKFPEPTLRTIVVINESGIHKVSYRFCACSLADHSNKLCQLLRNAWFPATNTDPDTCATFSVLDLFQLLNVGGNANVNDFISALERRTDAIASSGIRRVPVRLLAFTPLPINLPGF